MKDAIDFIEGSNLIGNFESNYFWNLSEIKSSESGPISCLRCFISNAINEKINVMFKKFSQLYEIELQDANNHLKIMNKFYSNLSSAMENVSEASRDSELFKKNLAQLSANLTTLNSVYGNMITAMKG